MYTILAVFVVSTIIFILQREYGILRRVGAFLIPLYTFCLGNNPDSRGYKYEYSLLEKAPDREWGFFYAMKILKSLGVEEYIYFAVLIAAISVVVFFAWQYQYEDTYYAVYLYMLFLVYYDIIQVRFGLSSFLVLLSLLLMVNKKSFFVSILVVMIAANIHISAITSIPVIIYIHYSSKKENYGFRYEEIYVIIMGVLSSIILGSIVLQWVKHQSYSFSSVLLYYTTEGLDFRSFIIWATPVILQIGVTWHYGVRHIIGENNAMVSEKDRRGITIMFRFILFGLLYLGFTLFMDEIVRMFRLYYLAMFFLYAMMRKYLESRQREIIFFSLAGCSIADMLAWVYLGVTFDSYWSIFG